MTLKAFLWKKLECRSSEKASAGKLASLPGQLGFLWPQAWAASPTLEPLMPLVSIPLLTWPLLANCSFPLQPPLLVTLCPEFFPDQPLRRRLRLPMLFLHPRPPLAGLLYSGPQVSWDQTRQESL